MVLGVAGYLDASLGWAHFYPTLVSKPPFFANSENIAGGTRNDQAAKTKSLRISLSRYTFSSGYYGSDIPDTRD